MTQYVDVLDHITKGRELPSGYDAWGFRTVRPDLKSSRGYRYPFPGRVAKAPGPLDTSNTDNCPRREGDGICLATTYAGMASGGGNARTLLLCAYRQADVLGGSRKCGKLRLRQFKVVDIIDGEAILANLAGAYLAGAYLAGAYLAGADLASADLAGANLTGANLTGANLTGANLTGAYLTGADLASADLASAYLASANLAGANLAGAYLAGAYLAGADLTRADLASAYLASADLAGADLAGADLAGANLAGANLAGANLTGANLTGADLASADLASALGCTLPAGWKLNASGLAVRA